MNVPLQLQRLVGEIVREFPASIIRWNPLPSGVCVLNVSSNGRDFELDYSPAEGTGVSENYSDTPPFVGHDEVFESLDVAVDRFKTLLASAARGEKSPRSMPLALHDKNL